MFSLDPQLTVYQTLGLLVGSMIVASRVTHGLARPSEFVMFITYLAQVSSSLFWPKARLTQPMFSSIRL